MSRKRKIPNLRLVRTIRVYYRTSRNPDRGDLIREFVEEVDAEVSARSYADILVNPLNWQERLIAHAITLRQLKAAFLRESNEQELFETLFSMAEEGGGE